MFGSPHFLTTLPFKLIIRSMNWWGLVVDGVSRIPWERLVFRPKEETPPEFPTAGGISGAQTAPESEIAGRTSHETKQAPFGASQSTPEKETLCIPCCIDHFSTCSGLVSDEAIRFAKRHSTDHKEVFNRICACRDQLNAMERVDLAAERVTGLQPWEKELAIYAQNQSAQIRHKLNEVSNAGDLENVGIQISAAHRYIARAWQQNRRTNSTGDVG